MKSNLCHLQRAETKFPDEEATGRLLSDEELVAGGLRRVSAFVREPRSPNAERQKRAKEKAVKQVNISVPDVHRWLIRSFAKSLQAGCTPQQSLERLLREVLATSEPDAIVIITSARKIALMDKVASLSGWRLLLARLIGVKEVGSRVACRLRSG